MDVKQCQCGCDASIKKKALGDIDKIKPPPKKKQNQKNMFIQPKKNKKNKSIKSY